jgi:hypothetical protein
MGGFVVTQLYGLSRATSDLDVLLIAPREQRAPLLELGVLGGTLHRKHKIYLDYVAVAKVPENYEDRLTEMFPGAYQHLRICALDPYDLALSKLERNIQRDRDDVKHLANSIPLDLKTLKERYEKELRWQLGIPTRGLNSKTLDRDDRRGQRRDCGRHQTMSDFFRRFSFASRRSTS